MKKRLFTTMAILGVSLFTFFAHTISASACLWGAYQPEEPKTLREE
ncbi:cyclic lactone autoinducer peptide [Tepidibacter formicigenes]|uniref:Cyclic lactone autoinducer peptide n=1 Tax=Tepidibacter formicigenes DSM 15518 TaxID=1123349 RepID=A0A1M6R0R6_9FIRM|nr:cyclic lactone autoinducer peptide [Tepidibacter formicigenes]SHK25990.1 cyclic lactone autoinducer peptide [Tepidibacter formicigenes DSM 15518]